MPSTLTKSKYCRGFQCPKMLWMDFHMPEERVKAANEAVLANGNLVGELAREYFGAYELVPLQCYVLQCFPSCLKL